MAGYDAPFHLSEECSNANIAGPRAIVLTAQLGLWLGWASILVIAYTVKDVQDVVSGKYGQPMVYHPFQGLKIFTQLCDREVCVFKYWVQKPDLLCFHSTYSLNSLSGKGKSSNFLSLCLCYSIHNSNLF